MADIEIPEKLEFLFQPARYKIAYGGRGGSKSWGAARALLIIGAEKPTRILCAREIQKSINDSVHKLLSDQVIEMGLSGFYEVQNTVIRGANGTEFTFAGLKHNVDNIKSVEGTDICWVEEAQTVSKTSWEKLVPTIRKDGSEIWVTFNPELDTDETYQRFVLDPPATAIVRKVNWSDNPWFPQVLRDEMEDLKRRDRDSYLTVWEGHCRQTLEGAVYAQEIRQATEEGRICKVKYDATKAVHVFCDLGWSDYTSLWFVQKVGLEYRILHGYQNRLQKWSHYLAYIQKVGYLIDRIWLPHDGANEQLSGKSIETITKESGFKCTIIKRESLKNGLNAAREVFPHCWFDEEGTKDALQSLRRYVWEITPQGLSTSQPAHDENSHFADGFRYFAVGFKEGIGPTAYAETMKRKLKRPVRLDLGRQNEGWMG